MTRFALSVILMVYLAMPVVTAEELVFESISDQLVKNMNEENTEKEITLKDEIVFVIIVFVTLLLVILGIAGSIFIAKSFSLALGFRQES